MPPFMETLVGTNEEQVVSYKNGNPVYDREESRDKTNLLKSGARKFISDWINIKNNKRICPRDARKAFEWLFYFPKERDMKLIGNLHHEDFKDTKIISYDKKCPYWKHPIRWFANLQDSAWKGAYIKMSGRLAPFLLVCYCVAANLRITVWDLSRCLKDEI